MSLTATMDSNELQELREQFDEAVKYERSTIPEDFNQVLLLDYLMDDTVEGMMSLSNRTDGKSFNYFHTLLKLAKQFEDFRFGIFATHYEARSAYVDLLRKINDEFGYSPDNIIFQSNKMYTKVWFGNEEVALITDIDHATDLKNYSSVLKDYRLMVFDEFIRIPSDYMPDEPIKLKTIYESVNRGYNPLMPKPKILLMGNPINMGSPLLAYWDLYEPLADQPMNSVKVWGNFAIERWRNDNANKKKESGLFSEVDNESITSEFKINNSLLVPKNERAQYVNHFNILLSEGYKMKVYYTDDHRYYIAIDAVPTVRYDFAVDLQDYDPEVRLLDDYDYDKYLIEDMRDGRIQFSDMASVVYMNTHHLDATIDVPHLITEHAQKYATDEQYQTIIDTERYEENRISRLKQSIFNQYFTLH